jgi:hypothetical protein
MMPGHSRATSNTIRRDYRGCYRKRKGFCNEPLANDQLTARLQAREAANHSQDIAPALILIIVQNSR